jgi:hypothetical protein
MLAQEIASLRGGAGGQQFEAAAVQVVILQGETCAVVHGRIVVDDADLPALRVRGRLCRRFVFKQRYEFSFAGHRKLRRHPDARWEIPLATPM